MIGSTRSAVPFLLVGVSGTGQRRSELQGQMRVQILVLPLTSSVTSCLFELWFLLFFFFYQVEFTSVSYED